MKYILIFCLSCLLNVSLYAQEPVLVIDPHGHSSKMEHILFTPDGNTLISTSHDKTVRLWDVETGDLLRTLRHQIAEGRDGEIHAAALSPDGTMLAIGGISDWNDPRGLLVYLYDLESGDITSVLGGHPDVVMELDFSSDGKWLVSGSGPVINLWKMPDISEEPLFTIESESDVFDLVFSPDGRQVASAHIDGGVRIWELPENLQNLEDLEGFKPRKIMRKHETVACCIAWSPDGKYLVSGDFNGQYFLWDAKKGKVKKAFKPADAASAVAFSADSEAVVISNGNRAEVYAVPHLKKSFTFEKHVSPIPMNAFSNSVTAIALYGDDLVATAGGINYDIYIWNRKTGDIKTHITGKGKRVEAVAFGADRHLAFGNTSGGMYKPGILERWFDLAEMQLHHKLPPHKEFVRARTEFQGKELTYTPGHKNPDDWYRLSIKGGGMIENAPNQGWVRSYTFTSDGNIVVGSSHVLRLHRSDGTEIREFTGHTGEIWGVSVSEDGKLLASASDDQTIKLWNLETGGLLATLFIARDREWVCWTPQGYYTASAGGEKYIGWQINQGQEQSPGYYPVSVFRKQFFYPDVVKHTIALGSFEQALAELDFTPRPAVTTVLPPAVQWIAPDSSMTEASQSTIRIQADIHSDSPLTAVKVLVNGGTQATSRGLALGGATQDALPLDNTIKQEITLIPGRNSITIFAANEDAGATSEERIIVYEAEEFKPNLYMVAVGISKYLLDELALEYADDDARAISQVFLRQEGQLYKKVAVKELYDLDATRDGIREAVAWLQQETTPKDVVVLFIAAHGTNEEGRYYLVSADANPNDMQNTGVSWNDFSAILGSLPSRVLMFLDTCHSGQLGQDVYTQQKQVDNTEALRSLSSDEYGVVILAASTGREFSLEHPNWGHGAFTKALLEALEQGKADYSGDGTVHLRELDLYVAERVEALTQGEQHPTTQKPSTISRLPVVEIGN